MSVSYTDNDYINSDGSVDWERYVDDNRDRVEELAESDRQVSWVFQRLLNYVGDGDSS